MNELLLMTVEMQVRLYVPEFQRRPWHDLMLIAQEAADIVACKGDVIQFREKGKTGPAVSGLSRGIAVLAMAPGGVVFMGYRWLARHPENNGYPDYQTERLTMVPVGTPGNAERNPGRVGSPPPTEKPAGGPVATQEIASVFDMLGLPPPAPNGKKP